MPSDISYPNLSPSAQSILICTPKGILEKALSLAIFLNDLKFLGVPKNSSLPS